MDTQGLAGDLLDAWHDDARSIELPSARHGDIDVDTGRSANVLDSPLIALKPWLERWRSRLDHAALHGITLTTLP